MLHFSLSPKGQSKTLGVGGWKQTQEHKQQKLNLAGTLEFNVEWLEGQELSKDSKPSWKK